MTNSKNFLSAMVEIRGGERFADFAKMQLCGHFIGKRFNALTACLGKSTNAVTRIHKSCSL